jgi:Amidase
VNSKLRDSLASYSGWLGYGHGERADAWLARLEVNRPELDLFRSAETPPCAVYAPRAATVLPADGGDRTVELESDASGALRRARDHASLNAFTWIAESAEGVPVAVKDLMHVRGAPLSCGSKAFDRAVSEHDAEVVARLRRWGAAIVGLTNLHEFAAGITSDNAHFLHAFPGDRAADPPPPSQRASSASRSAPIPRARSAFPRLAAASSDSSRAMTRCRAKA